MNKNEWPRANPCSRCGKKPEQIEIHGLYYVQCKNCERIEVSVTKKIVTENWNSLYGRTNMHYSSSAPKTNGGRGKKKTVKSK